jgi:hypothetical protein
MTETPEDDRPDVEPAPEPTEEVSDPHTGPLDDDDDARYLSPNDERRRRVEKARGRPFGDED